MATVEADVLGPRLDAARAGLGDGGVTVSTSRDIARSSSGDEAAGGALVGRIWWYRQLFTKPDGS